MSNLYSASNQWSSRPADERFSSVRELLAATQGHRDSARSSTFAMNKLRVQHTPEALMLQGPQGGSAKLTHYAFGQLCTKSGAPAGYLRNLPGELAAVNLSYGLSQLPNEMTGVGLFHSNGSLVARCVTSEKYTRIWNCEVAERLIDLESIGWRVPPARPAMPNQPGSRIATESDVLRRNSQGGGLSINVGDLIAPAGLYASDHDMFAFMVDETAAVDDGSDKGLARGFFIENSEVGAASLSVTQFLYRHVCGNHIVWGAKGVQKIKIVHRGAADERFRDEVVAELRKYADQSGNEEEARIVACKRCVLGTNKTEVLDLIFGKRIMSRTLAESAYVLAEQEEAATNAGSPNTAWGFAQGITRLSQVEGSGYADNRVEIDRAAGKVLDLAF